MEFAQALIDSVKESPYSPALVSTIKSNRANRNGKLLFDIMAHEVADIDSTSLYPPTDAAQASKLISLFASQDNTQPLHKVCLTYYVFLDYPEDLTQGDHLGYYFADETDMPRGFRELVEGLWCIDRQQYDQGLKHLCHPEVRPTFVDEIISALPDGKHVLAYITSSSPKLLNDKTVSRCVNALCSVSLFQALEFARSASSDVQEDLLAEITKFCFANDPRRNIWRLANLPLSKTEDKLLVERILPSIISSSTEETERSLAKDILLVRSLHTGNKEAAALVSELKGSTSAGGISWTNLAQGLTH